MGGAERPAGAVSGEQSDGWLDNLYELDVQPGDGILMVSASLTNLTRGCGVIWCKLPGAAQWQLAKSLPRNGNAKFAVGGTQSFRGGRVLLVFELRDAAAKIGSAFDATGELLVDGAAVPGSRQRTTGTFDRRMRLEAIQWSLS
jgi:hypothetical protein